MPRHHLVPQMLLRQFADGKSKISMVSRQSPAQKRITTVRTACAEVGYYAISTDDVELGHRSGHDPEGVEAALARIEGDAVPIIEKLNRGELPVDEESRYRMSLFMALQFSRVWRFREDVNDMGTAIAREHLAVLLTDDVVAERLRQQGKAVNPAAVEAYRLEIIGGGWRVELSQPHLVQQALRFAVEFTLPELLRRRWRILRFCTPLVLSDSPVALWSPRFTNGDAGMPPGVATARMILLPIGRYAALGAVRGGQDAVVDASRLRAQQINTAVSNNAHRWIFHHPEDDPLSNVEIDPPGVVTKETQSVREDDDGLMRVSYTLARRPPAEG
ncbi:DUF4238 domain-containing protein [Micromonospora chalcea]|uniref:DUF4238 domain-containing protein n=1 Tax=Micromonospora chalcea TaxID=1874 RepID=UPI0033D6F97E